MTRNMIIRTLNQIDREKATLCLYKSLLITVINIADDRGNDNDTITKIVGDLNNYYLDLCKEVDWLDKDGFRKFIKENINADIF